MVPATNTTTTRRTPSRDKTIFRKHWGGRPSTIRRIAASNARYASGWITGRSCVGSVSANENFLQPSCTDPSGDCCRDAGVDASCNRRDRRGDAGRAGDEAKLHGAGQRAAVLRIYGQESGAEGRG